MSETMSGMGRNLFEKAHGGNVKPQCQLCKFFGDNYENHTTLDCDKKRSIDDLWKANLTKGKATYKRYKDLGCGQKDTESAEPLSLIIPFIHKNIISGCSEDEDSFDLDHGYGPNKEGHSSIITPDAKALQLLV